MDSPRQNGAGNPMKLDDVLKGNEAFVFMERYVDEAVKNYSPFAGLSEAAPEYQPRSGLPSFDLITVLAPKSRVSIFQDNPVRSLRDHYIGSESVLFAIHPDTWSSI